VIHHYGGLSPAWPLSYQDFEPFYAEAERLYHVHGKAGDDPTEGPRSGEYPYAPVLHEPRIQQLHDDLEHLGLHPFYLPIGVMLDQDEHGDATHASPCIRCNRVDGFPCLVDGKADSQVVCVDPALAAHPNLTLLTNAHVQRLETDSDGRQVTAVVATMQDGSTARFSGDVVVVSCGALNSALLLLRSSNDAHPRGLANGSDQVGRNYVRHNNLAVMALSREPNPTIMQRPWPSTTGT
jgi:choline dehydrogenase-like flavoprotein